MRFTIEDIHRMQAQDRAAGISPGDILAEYEDEEREALDAEDDYWERVGDAARDNGEDHRGEL